jgi:hypothetical protein
MHPHASRSAASALHHKPGRHCRMPSLAHHLHGGAILKSICTKGSWWSPVGLERRTWAGDLSCALMAAGLDKPSLNDPGSAQPRPAPRLSRVVNSFLSRGRLIENRGTGARGCASANALNAAPPLTPKCLSFNDGQAGKARALTRRLLD